ncbi:MAG: GlsB/YeaQ/YmgE family stress response membrane protein [Anaerolineae bacterium]|nr:GlsB/YeaQ/YmgE family stress response membrane protein [Anaerolineae bacterium]
MGAIVWIILGIVAGVVTCQLRQRTAVKNYIVYIIVGVAGSFLGGFTANLVTRNPVFALSFSSLLVALFGTVVFLGIFSAIQR